MTTEAIALFRKFGLHASADALALRNAYREAKTCAHLDSDPRDEPCATCRRFERWEGARGAEPFGEIDAMLARVRELRGDRPFDEVRQTFNAAADRLEVLASKLSEARNCTHGVLEVAPPGQGVGMKIDAATGEALPDFAHGVKGPDHG